MRAPLDLHDFTFNTIASCHATSGRSPPAPPAAANDAMLEGAAACQARKPPHEVRLPQAARRRNAAHVP